MFKDIIKMMAISKYLVFMFLTNNLVSMPEMVVIVPSYNNKTICEKNIASIVSQKTIYPFHVFYINDNSSDGTGDIINLYIKRHGLDNLVTLINNETRKGALENLYTVIHRCSDDKIIITVDGDDFLAHDNVLERVVYEYTINDAWITYGQFAFHPTYSLGYCTSLPEDVIKNNTFRKCLTCTSHLRTFYAGLFKKIKKEDLMYNGTFFTMAWDTAMMLPMLEMASRGHIKFINDILYLYNSENPLSDHNINRGLQKFFDSYIRSQRSYDPLDKL